MAFAGAKMGRLPFVGAKEMVRVSFVGAKEMVRLPFAGAREMVRVSFVGAKEMVRLHSSPDHSDSRWLETGWSRLKPQSRRIQSLEGSPTHRNAGKENARN